MKQAAAAVFLMVQLAVIMTACGKKAESQEVTSNAMDTEYGNEPYTIDTAIVDVINDPVFGDYGRLIFPVGSWYYSGDTLGNLHLIYYSNIDPNETVEIPGGIIPGATQNSLCWLRLIRTAFLKRRWYPAGLTSCPTSWRPISANRMRKMYRMIFPRRWQILSKKSGFPRRLRNWE